jgi:hypothetical protein
VDLDPDRIDDAVLALLRLGLHDEHRVWKGFDWDALARLHEKGFITDPVGRAKSVLLTEAGLAESERLLVRLFGREGPSASVDPPASGGPGRGGRA